MLNGIMQDRPLLLSGIIEHAARCFPDTEVVARTIEGDLHRYTYAQARSRMKRLAKAFQKLGVRPGDREIPRGIEEQLRVRPMTCERGHRNLERERHAVGRPRVAAPAGERPGEIRPDALEVGSGLQIAEHSRDRVAAPEFVGTLAGEGRVVNDGVSSRLAAVHVRSGSFRFSWRGRLAWIIAPHAVRRGC